MPRLADAALIGVEGIDPVVLAGDGHGARNQSIGYLHRRQTERSR